MKIVATAMALAAEEHAGQPPHRIDGDGGGCRGDGAARRPLVAALLCGARQEEYAGVGVATWHGLGGWVGTLAAAVYCKGGGEGIKGRVKFVAAVKLPLEALPAVQMFGVGVVEAACELLAGMLPGCAAGHGQMKGGGDGKEGRGTLDGGGRRATGCGGAGRDKQRGPPSRCAPGILSMGEDGRQKLRSMERRARQLLHFFLSAEASLSNIRRMALSLRHSPALFTS